MELYLILGTIAAAVAIIAFTATIGRKMWNFVRQLTHFFEDWFGEAARPGVVRRPGVMERLDNQDHQLADHGRKLGNISTRLEVVEAELTPNSGKSIKDAVCRIDETLNGDV